MIALHCFFRATEENSKMKTRYEQTKEEVESLVSEFESCAHAFLFFQLIVILSVLQKEKIEVNQARFVRLFVFLCN